MTSADASDSIALSCCASAPRRAIRTAATANVTLASRISPSGTRLTIAAVALGTASAVLVSRSTSEVPRMTAKGAMTATSASSSRLSARSSGDRGWRNARACPLSRCA
jgi:hypothetical protein